MTLSTTLPREGRRRLRMLGASAAAVFVLLVGLAHPAAASQPASGNAVGTFTFLSRSVKPIGNAGGIRFLREVASISYAGDITGVVTATDTIVMRSDGSFIGFGREACKACTIGGRTGSFTAVFTFSGSDAGVKGTEIFVSGGGGLQGLRGGGTFVAAGDQNTYDFHYRF